MGAAHLSATIFLTGDIKRLWSRGKVSFAILLILMPLVAAPSLAQEMVSPRMQIGIGLLPAVIAANKRLASESGSILPVYLVYKNDRHLAEQLRPGLEKVDRIQQRRLEVESITLGDLLASDPAPASAIFIAETLGSDLEPLIEFVERKKILLFSPFKGDVERGVAAGFRVTDKVLPMVNMTALKQSNIQLKAFFLRVAVKHE